LKLLRIAPRRHPRGCKEAEAPKEALKARCDLKEMNG
jgi:hypothetical protein